jgi:hypothetical protein
MAILEGWEGKNQSERGEKKRARKGTRIKVCGSEMKISYKLFFSSQPAYELKRHAK